MWDGGGLFRPQHKEMEGKKGEKAASKGPSPALVDERREFMTVPDTHWSSEQGLEPASFLILLGWFNTPGFSPSDRRQTFAWLQLTGCQLQLEDTSFLLLWHYPTQQDPL